MAVAVVVADSGQDGREVVGRSGSERCGIYGLDQESQKKSFRK